MMDADEVRRFIAGRRVYNFDPETRAFAAEVEYRPDGACALRFATGETEAGVYGFEGDAYWTRYEAFRGGARHAFRLEPLGPDDLSALVSAALADTGRGLGDLGLAIAPDAAAELANRTGGDARQALNALEVAAMLATGAARSEIGVEDIGEALQRRIVRYDRAGDNHYDVISAFIKSVRGSDPDAALYWLFLMLEGGEDPEFIARRLLILASEDVGLADSNGIQVAAAAAQALAYVGLPEAAFHLTHATVYLATAPKSNSLATAMGSARRLVAERFATRARRQFHHRQRRDVASED